MAFSKDTHCHIIYSYNILFCVFFVSFKVILSSVLLCHLLCVIVGTTISFHLMLCYIKSFHVMIRLCYRCYLILSDLSHLILSYHILSYHTLSSLLLSYLTSSYFILSYLVSYFFIDTLSFNLEISFI